MRRLVTAMVRCQTELYKAYTGDADFREWLNGEMFRATYQTGPDSASKTEHLPIAAHRKGMDTGVTTTNGGQRWL